MSKYICIHDYGLAFVVGFYNSKEDARNAYKLFIESHKNWETIKQEFYQITGKILNILDDDDDVFDFRDKKQIGYSIIKSQTLDLETISDFGPWKPGFDGENHLEEVINAHVKKENYQIDIAKVSLYHPIF